MTILDGARFESDSMAFIVVTLRFNFSHIGRYTMLNSCKTF